MGRVSCTKLVRAGLVVWWILVYGVLVSVMWRTGGQWPDGIHGWKIVWMSGGSQGILLATRYFVLFFAADPLSWIAQGISGNARRRREAREAEALRAAREAPTESQRDAQDGKSRHKRLMRLWRGVAKAAPKLICAQQRAAERVFAPDADGYRNALEHFQRLARGERLAAIYHSMGSPARVAQALWLNRMEASLRFSATAADRSERSEKPENLV